MELRAHGLSNISEPQDFHVSICIDSDVGVQELRGDLAIGMSELKSVRKKDL